MSLYKRIIESLEKPEGQLGDQETKGAEAQEKDTQPAPQTTPAGTPLEVAAEALTIAANARAELQKQKEKEAAAKEELESRVVPGKGHGHVQTPRLK